MKKLLLSLFVCLTFLCMKCEEETPKEPIDLLPPPTQTGENTFGCLVDGEPFTPDGRPLSFTTEYSYYQGEHYLRISGDRRYEDGLLSIGIGTEGLAINEGETYELLEREQGNAYGSRYKSSNFTYTSSESTGKLIITKLDTEEHIMSGTFFFDIKSVEGKTYKVREGRFDIKY